MNTLQGQSGQVCLVPSVFKNSGEERKGRWEPGGESVECQAEAFGFVPSALEQDLEGGLAC
jgi:hypothetical protein